MVVGLIKKNSTIDIKTKRRVSIHEAGHALLVLKFSKYFDFQKVSIQPTYNGAGGYTLFTENPSIKDGKLYTKDFLKKRLIITMGGKAAENIFYGDNFVSLGSTEDLKQANKLAQKMIGNFGMGNNLEVFFNENLDDNLDYTKNKYSEYTKEMIDKESLSLVKEAYDEAKILLLSSSKSLFILSELLANNTVLYKKDITDNFLI
jgi:cell division protease FtsH